jgi:hypothetical protein
MSEPRFAPRQTDQAKLVQLCRSWRHMQFSPASAPLPYLNTARSAPRREIASVAQVRNAYLGNAEL